MTVICWCWFHWIFPKWMGVLACLNAAIAQHEMEMHCMNRYRCLWKMFMVFVSLVNPQITRRKPVILQLTLNLNTLRIWRHFGGLCVAWKLARLYLENLYYQLLIVKRKVSQSDLMKDVIQRFFKSAPSNFLHRILHALQTLEERKREINQERETVGKGKWKDEIFDMIVCLW